MREPPTPRRDAGRVRTRPDANEDLAGRTPGINGPGQDTPPLPPSARGSDPGTSWAASRDVEGYRPRIVDDLVVRVAQAGRTGQTTIEVVDRRGGDRANTARRMTDARLWGWVRASGRRKSLRTGRWSTVWVATASGQKHAAAVLAAMAHEGAA